MKSSYFATVKYGVSCIYMVGGSLVEDFEHHGLEDNVDLVGEPLLVVLPRLGVCV